jgi:hypothetical protein
MNDRVFERGLTALTVLVMLFIVAGLVFNWLGAFWTVFIGLAVEITGGGALVYFWGKDYMGRA